MKYLNIFQNVFFQKSNLILQIKRFSFELQIMFQRGGIIVLNLLAENHTLACMLF